MKRLATTLFATALLLALGAVPAQAEFGFSEFNVAFKDSEGNPVTQAGSHPYEMEVSQEFVSVEENVEEAAKDIVLTLPEGFVGNPTAVPPCATADFLLPPAGDCPDASALGGGSVKVAVSGGGGGTAESALYNLEPPPGSAAKLGIWFLGVPVVIEAGVNPTPPYNVLAGATNISQVLEVLSANFTLWGTPADPGHDEDRGKCFGGGGSTECPANIAEVPFLTMPRSCTGPLQTAYAIDSWQNPGAKLEDGRPDLSDPNWVTGATETRDANENPIGLSGCGKLGFGPELDIQPTTTQAESASGLDLSIEIEDEGLANPDGIAAADIEATEIRLPQGVTVNPSAAEGLGVCSKAQFAAASLKKKGCPDASKLGSLEVDTPILENHTLKGSFYLAQQDNPATKAKGAENPFDSLLAAYLVIRDEALGVFVKLPAEVETDEKTGQIVTTVRDMPAFPLEDVQVHLRSGPRAPLITPPACGTYTTTAILTPSSGAKPLSATSSFAITSGPNGSPCPAGGVPPFNPGFEAGSENGAAGAFSPFAMRLTRNDGEQDLTKFSAVLPPGVVPKLAGVEDCPDAAIEEAKLKTGREEQASPSCPANSKVGSILAGAGVGSALTYVPGTLHLAGPYKGAPLSAVAIVPAIAGPFDVGTVVTRVGLKLNPTTYRGEVDGAASDPIPHILEGIPVKVRDIRVMADRQDFTLNPTSCDPYDTGARIFGSFADPFNPADDRSVDLSSRYQAANCLNLGLKPRLSFALKGGTKRGANPALTATYVPRPGDANLEGLVVRLPRSAFLDQSHIRTICTRVQFAAEACPPAAQYGFVKASTPLLDEPLQGPVWLRSSNHNLPDIVFDLKGLVDIEVSTRIDSFKGGIRATVENAPDAPITEFVLSMQGGRKGLIDNSRNLCTGKPARANVRFVGQNGKASKARPVMRADCRGGRKQQRRRR